MPNLTFDYEKIQKVEFKGNQCNIGVTNFDGTGTALLITDVPAAAGSMIGALSSFQYFVETPAGGGLKPRVYVELTTPVAGGTGFKQAKCTGRIELREFN